MPRPLSERLLRLLWWAACLGLAAAGANYALRKSMHHDVAYFVNAVERLHDGARLYRDLIDVNVPTIYGVTALPVWLGRQLGVETTLAFNLFVLLMAVLSVWTTVAVARRVLPNAGILPDVLAGILLIGFLVLPGFDFGQREHLATMLVMPYAATRAGVTRTRLGTTFRAAVGIAAGIGVALKPQFALIPLGMEGALMLRRGPSGWRPGVEVAFVALAIGIAAAVTLVFFPEYHQRILPLARATYHGFERPLITVFLSSVLAQGEYLLMALAAALLAIGANQRHGDLVVILLGGALGSYAAYVQQSKGWYYQLLPALVFSLVAFAVVFAARLRGETVSKRLSLPLSVAAIAVLGMGAVLVTDLTRAYRRDAARREFFASTIDVLRERAQGGPALFLSLDVDYAFPGVNYAGAIYPYRWHHLLPLPGLYRDFVPGPDGRLFRRPEEMGPIEREFFESFIDDAIKFPPRLILVDRRRSVRPGLSPDVDLFAYFCQSLRFAALMRGYEWLGRRGFYDVLAPGTRSGSPGPCALPRPDFDP